MTFDDLRHEYQRVRIGETILTRVQSLVRQVAQKYPPAVYSEIAPVGGDWTDEALEALSQDFITRSLLTDGQLDYTLAQAATLLDFDRLTRFQLRRYMRDIRRRTVIDNLLDRVRDRLATPAYEALGDDGWSIAGRSVPKREAHRDELERALQRASLIPREATQALHRAPRVYAPNDLDSLVRAVAESLECPLSLDHVRWVFEQLLTELAPSELLPIHEDMAEAEEGVEYASWVETSVRQERHGGGPLIAEPEPSPEEAALVTEAVQDLRASLNDEEAEILRLKLAGLPDAKVASAVNLSRATIVARNKGISVRIDEHFSALDERWHRRALDELVRSLGDA